MDKQQQTDYYTGRIKEMLRKVPDKVNNVAWVVRLSIDRQGVRAWQAHRVDIDAQGLPHAGKRAQTTRQLDR